MALKSTLLMVVAIAFLVIPGMLYNNLSNNGLAVGQTQTLTCSSDSQTPTCQISGTVGCQNAVGNTSDRCTLKGASISFLSGTSPFTQLVQGNIFGFFSNLNGPGYQGPGAQSSIFSTHGPFDVSQGGTFYSANCGGQPAAGSKSQTKWAMGVCTQTYTDNANTTKAASANWTNWNTQQSGVNQKLAFFGADFANGTFNHSCSWIAQINYTAIGGASSGPGFTYFGCSVSKPNHALVITDPQWDFLVAMPVSSGPMPAGFSHQYVWVQLENWATPQCSGNGTPQGSPYASIGCSNFATAFQGILLPGTAVTFVPGVNAASIGFFAGIILLVLSLGLSFGFGGGVSAGSNEQGTRLAQTLGLGLIVWSPLYSEFGTWFTTGKLPFGFDGNTGIIALLLTGMFFFAVFWRALSRD